MQCFCSTPALKTPKQWHEMQEVLDDKGDAPSTCRRRCRWGSPLPGQQRASAAWPCPAGAAAARRLPRRRPPPQCAAVPAAALSGRPPCSSWRRMGKRWGCWAAAAAAACGACRAPRMQGPGPTWSVTWSSNDWRETRLKGSVRFASLAQCNAVIEASIIDHIML